MEEVMVFKTNATEHNDLSRLDRLLKNCAGIKDWNFDFEDCDHIFRLVSTGISNLAVKKLLSEAGIEAFELEDDNVNA